MFADHSLKDGRIADVIERLLASINELQDEHWDYSPSASLFPFTGQLNTITNTVIHQISTNDTLAAPLQTLFETDTSFITSGTHWHTTASWFFEEEKYSANTVDGGAEG